MPICGPEKIRYIVTLLILGLPAYSRAAPSVEVIPLARYVSEYPKLYGYSDFNASVAAGTAVYDDTFRHPFLPLGRLILDCRKVKRVGVTLALRFAEFRHGRLGNRYPTSHIKDTTVKYIWSHSGHLKKGGKYFTKRRIRPRKELEMVSDGLNLGKADRVDGVVTIKIRVNSILEYETSFELVGCDNGK